ncbi:hypothetical protein Nmel_017824 [Mimus melanotis]
MGRAELCLHIPDSSGCHTGLGELRVSRAGSSVAPREGMGTSLIPACATQSWGSSDWKPAARFHCQPGTVSCPCPLPVGSVLLRLSQAVPALICALGWRVSLCLLTPSAWASPGGLGRAAGRVSSLLCGFCCALQCHSGMVEPPLPPLLLCLRAGGAGG